MPTFLTRATKSAKAKLALTLLTALAVLGATAFTVFGAPNTVKDNPGAATSAEATQNANKRFTIEGNLGAPLVLGAPGEPVDLVVHNPNPQTLVVGEIRVEIAGVAPAVCGVANFAVTQTTATITVPPKSSAHLALASRPRVAWVNDPNVAQDHCLGARLSFRYTGKGTLR